MVLKVLHMTLKVFVGALGYKICLYKIVKMLHSLLIEHIYALCIVYLGNLGTVKLLDQVNKQLTCCIIAIVTYVHKLTQQHGKHDIIGLD